MRRGERDVAGGMPVLRGEGVRERPVQQAVEHRHHRLPLYHRQFAAGHEGGLHIDQPENRSGQVPHHGTAAGAFAAAGAGVFAG